jgi:hypothetical protein
VKPPLIGAFVLLVVVASAVFMLLSSLDKKETVRGVLLYASEPGLCGLAEAPSPPTAGSERLPVADRLAARGVRTVLDRHSCEQHRVLEGQRVRAEGRRVSLLEATGRSDLSNLSAIAAHEVAALP